MSLIQRSLHVYMFLCVFVCVCVCSHSMIWEAHDIMDLWCVCLHHVSRDGILVRETIWFSEKHRRFWNLRQDLRLNLVLMASEHALSSSFTFYTIRKEMATHSSILAWRIPWTEELGRLQSTGSQRVGYDWVTSLQGDNSSLREFQKMKASNNVLSCFSCVWLFETLWTVACQAPLSMGFSRQEYWGVFPGPPPGDLPYPGIKPESLWSPTLAGRFFTTSTT